MQWSTRFQSYAPFGQAVRLATGRPSWVLRATGLVAAIVFLVPLLALAVLMIAAAIVTALSWMIFNTIASVIDAFAGGRHPDAPGPQTPSDDGRENVRVVQRP